MSTPHEAIAAWPVTGNADKALARAITTRRLPYSLSSAESAADLVVVDPATGVVPLYLIQNGTLFEYDSLDSTTVASAVCLVTNDSKRYKSGGITPPFSVLTVGTTAQPATPAIGDTYLIPTAATGAAWAGNDGKIGIYSRAGWQFAISPIGRGLYAEDTNIRWYRNAAGTWVSGFGAVSVGAGGINITNMLGAKASFVVKVENQTTETPPASPVAFVAYIVGAAPTGSWSAYSPGDVAMCLADGIWTRVQPAAGDEVYDKTLGINYKRNAANTAWVSAGGSIIQTDYVFTASGLSSSAGSGFSAYSASTPPTKTLSARIDDATLSFQARPNAILLISYDVDVVASGSTDYVVGVFRDSETNAIDWARARTLADGTLPRHYEFVAEAPSDGVAKTYRIQMSLAANTATPSAPTRRLLKIQELA